VRKMFSFMITTADGYRAGPGQALDWQTIDGEFSQQAQRQPGKDIVIQGSSALTAGLLYTGLLFKPHGIILEEARAVAAELDLPERAG
jgi:hypothetical protein